MALRPLATQGVVHLVQRLNDQGSIRTPILRIIPQFEHRQAGGPGGVGLGLVRKELFHRIVHRRSKAPAEEEAALARGRGKLSIGHQLRFGPAVPDQDAGVAGEHQVLEVAGDRLFHVDRGAGFL